MEAKTIVEVFNSALKDLNDIPKELPNQRFPQEAQLRAALYRAFRDKMFKVCVDARYPNDHRRKCDLVVMENDKEIWIELNISTSKNSSKIHKKWWDDDVKKFRKYLHKKNTQNVFVLCYFYYDESKTGKVTKNEIEKYRKGPSYSSEEVDFSWKGVQLTMVLYGWE